MLYSRYNYLMMLISIALIILGFILMSGGGSTDPNTFNPEIFSPLRIRIAPAIALLGFILMIYALMANPCKPKETPETNPNDL